MGLYAALAKLDTDNPELHEFWMSMARHEAGHVGALTLIATLLEQGGPDVELVGATDALHDAERAIEALEEEVAAGVARDRAFAIAVELESLELEDLVLDLIHVLSDSAARQQAEQLLIHDLSDLSLAIEKFCRDDALLAKADDLVEARVGRPERKPVVSRRA